jgi:hypothetical protein
MAIDLVVNNLGNQAPPYAADDYRSPRHLNQDKVLAPPNTWITSPAHCGGRLPTTTAAPIF